jgi:hypothetical protein
MQQHREDELVTKLMNRLIALVDRVRSKNKCTQLQTYPMNAICGREKCKMDWGDHIGAFCPDGKGVFTPGRELVLQEIDKLESEEKQ